MDKEEGEASSLSLDVHRKVLVQWDREQNDSSTSRPAQSSFRAKVVLLLLVPFLLVLSDIFSLPPATSIESWTNQWRGELRAKDDAKHLPLPITYSNDLSEDLLPVPVLKNGSVTWDKYSLVVNGERLLLWSGEFHTWRLPVVELWRDVLEKFKAAGLNSVSIYIHWGLVNPSPGVFDFDGYRALEPFFEMARDVGLWVVVRPGPYINAETNGGGIPGWVTTLPARLRTSDPAFTDAWRPFIKRVAEIVAPWQVTRTPGGRGPVIAVQVDNEYEDDGDFRTEYMRLVEEELKKGGIDVPLTFNDAERFNNFVRGPAKVDIYGFDSYPLGFDCSHPDKWDPLREGYRTYHEVTNPDQPLYIPEYQGGAFDPWGGPGYEACRELTGAAFESVFNLHLLAENVKMANIYMVYGGTSWGSLPFPGVYTSYDYGSAVQENRALTAKFPELKAQGLFIAGSPEFAKTDFIGNSSTRTYTDNDDVWATELKNPDTGAKWLVVRHKDSTSSAKVKFRLDSNFTDSTTHYHLRGRESHILSFDTKVGAATLLKHASASVFWSGRVGDRDLVILRAHPEDSVQVKLARSGLTCDQMTASKFHSTCSSAKDDGQITLDAAAADVDSPHAVRTWAFDGLTVAIASSAAVDKLWVTAVDSGLLSVGTAQNVIVDGPDLVRSASISCSGHQLHLRGDVKLDLNTGLRDIAVLGPAHITSISWNGRTTSVTRDALGWLRFSISPTGSMSVPNLHEWRYADSLPEIRRSFSSSTAFVPANLTSTNNPHKPFSGKYVLYGCDYGFCEGTLIWRGRFEGGVAHGINLTIAGGNAFAASAWVNEKFIGSINASEALQSDRVNVSLPLSYGALRDDFNVITIVQDTSGMEETIDGNPETIKNPRGILGYELLGKGELEWEVAGRLGGYNNFGDAKRGIFNEGAFFGERSGWHQPGVDDFGWQWREIETGLPNGQPGVGFFRTTFELNVEKNFDAMMSINVIKGKGRYRAYIFVNGWQFGKYVSDYGPQHRFPVPNGILQHNGVNTLAVAIWALEPDVAPGGFFLALDDVYYQG